MTKSRYIIAICLKQIGIFRKQKRLQDAAKELQLLNQAEEILGSNVWQNLKEMDSYKSSYWKISGLLKEKLEHVEKVNQISAKLEEIKHNQESNFMEGQNSDHNLEEMYEKQILVIKKIKSEQSDISEIADNIKNSYEGAVAKLNFISKEGAARDEIDAEKAKIRRLKDKFIKLKERKVFSDQKLAEQTAILNQLSDSLKNTKSNYKDKVAFNYEIRGKANKAISFYNSKIGLLDNKIIAHYKEIGKTISKECYTDKSCRRAVKHKLNLCKIMKSLRESINYNHTLAGR